MVNAAAEPIADKLAEQALIGWCIRSERIPDEADTLTADEFYWPQHAQIWQAMADQAADGYPLDVYAVQAKLIDRGQLDRVGGIIFLMECVGMGVTGDPGYLSSIIADRAGKRRLLLIADQIKSDIHTREASYEEHLEMTERRLAEAPTAHDTDDIRSMIDLAEFVGVEVAPPNWVIRDYLCRDERLMITGYEGLGKSTLIRQLAVCAAAGMDPFSGASREPQTALVIDAENPLGIMQRRFHELRQAVNAHGRAIEPGRLMIDRRPEGIDLGDSADRRWLRRRVLAAKPDILVIGPVYKLFTASDDRSHEVSAQTLSAVFDDIRTEAGCALVLEAHAGNELVNGKRSLRPIGSSLWRRWCDFGMGIRKAQGDNAQARRLVEIDEWKSPRDPRKWPEMMESTGYGMPWVETVEDVGNNVKLSRVS